MSDFDTYDDVSSFDIAIIGMNGRFPGARNLKQFWHNLQNGVESITLFTDEEVAAAGVPAEIYQNPHYVKAGAILDDVEQFDADFFGFYPREASLMDPQHRLFLETAWHALETAGYDPERYQGLIGVYASTSMNTYLLFNLSDEVNISGSADIYPLAIGNDKDFLTTRVSYKLNLKGPSVNVQSACSSSLVATHLACQALLNYQCDIALAGGVAVGVPQKRGYLYQEGGIASSDGHCRPFDADGKGTIGGSGVGIVVLKRLTDAIADGDHIYAVIKGSATNNDGSLKVGYTAPSVDGQANVIAAAQMLAEVEPETIGYIEAHGTGTTLGDPIEIAALTEVFRASTDARQFCAVSAVKSNIGHLDAAAGVAGLIKAALALQNKQIPPIANFGRPNPGIDFANSPFFSAGELLDWETHGTPRRAGVSSFGIGGTNAHVVLEEAPQLGPSGPSRAWQMLLLSAKSEAALDEATWNLTDHLLQETDVNLADVAYTYQTGRRVFNHRRVAIVGDTADAVEVLSGKVPQRLLTGYQEVEKRPIAFMFTGQGAQYPDMGRELYETEPVFRETVDLCCAFLEPLLGLDLRELLYPHAAQAEAAAEQLAQTHLTQPALFTIEYALASLWLEWGIEPAAMIGHSIGEYVAACVAGVFALQDALALVAARGRMMQDLPGGAMLSLPLTEEETRPYLTPSLSLAAINAHKLTVISGPFAEIDALETRLTADGISYRRLHTSHAFHSPMMDPILAPFTQRVAEVPLSPPAIPFVSNVTGTWITAEQATDPAYWATHLRRGVRFADGLRTLLEDPLRALLEVGPGRTLATLARQHPATTRDQLILTSLRHPKETHSDVAFILASLGKLWLGGVAIDWEGFYTNETRRRVPLPTYPFERKRYWIEPRSQRAPEPDRLRKRQNISDWFYLPSWQRADLPTNGTAVSTATWLMFIDDALGPEATAQLRKGGHRVVTVAPGSTFARHDDHSFSLRPGHGADYRALFAALQEASLQPEHIVHFWSAQPGADLDATFYSLLSLVQGLDAEGLRDPLRLDVITTNLHEIVGSEVVQPGGAAAFGLSRVIPQEFTHFTCRTIDLPDLRPEFAPRLLGELIAAAAEACVAYRGHHRWVQTFVPLRLDGEPSLLRQGGVYLITGGLGRIGRVFAEYLAQTAGANLVLVDRTSLPPRDSWAEWFANHSPDDPTSQRLATVQALEEMGATVMTAVADVTDESAMQAVVEDIYAKFSALHGVIHAAGLVGDQAITPIQSLDHASAAAQFAPKINGVTVLETVLAGREVDFCLLQSSLSSILGGMGFGAYAAANAYLDAVAQHHANGSSTRWISVDWDGWRFAEEANAPAGLAELSITPEEGAAALGRILSLDLPPQLVVSTGDLEARLARWVQPAAQTEATEPETADFHARPSLKTDYTAPRSELETAVATLWQTVLGLDQVGVHDDFFELGGHSLLATQIISRLRDMYAVELPLRDLFEQPTVAGLASLIEAGLDEEPAVGPMVTAVSRDADLPLSFGQQRLWFLDQLEPGSPLYNNFAAIRLSGKLDVPVLMRCVNEIVARHEVLRTTFAETEGSPVQVIAPGMQLDVPVVDLQHLSPDEQEDEIVALARAEGSQSFDLSTGPLLRLKLIRQAPETHLVFMTMHHIVSDGWSVGVLVREVAALYAAFAAGEPSPLPELAIQYADYAHWQRAWLQGDVLDAQLNFWREQLADAPTLELPTDFPRPAVQTSNGASAWFDLPRNLYEDLLALSRAEGVTLFMTLLAALQTLLYRYTEQEDFCVGTPVANRTRSETEPLIGFLLNTLVLRSDMTGTPSFRELLERVRTTALAAYDHQDVPFEMLVEKLQPGRDMSRAPFFQVMFDLQKATLPRLQLGELTFSQLRVDNGTAKFDLALSMEEGPDGLYGYLNYNTDLFRAETVQAMLGHFQTLLAGIVTDPDLSVARLPLLTKAEVDKLLGDWRQTAVSPHPYRSIMSLIEAQATERPAAEAVVLDDAALTYAELNGRATQLAHHLQQTGVQPGDVVGLYTERSLDALIGLLGILKAGGVYLPLETSMPLERLTFIIEDARAAAVITDATHSQFTIHASQLTIDTTTLASQADTTPQSALFEPKPDDPAYVIYTSGSTGTPKGVVISHGAISGHIRDASRHFGLTPEDRVLQFAALSFDQSIEQILATWATGAALVVRGPQVWSPTEFAQVVADFGLTVINLPPAYWNQWLQVGAETLDVIPRDQLKLIIVGGDVMLAEGLRTWQQSPLRSARLLNAYGPTEATITALTYEVSAPLSEGQIPIGRPLPNRTVYILDQSGNLLPPGVPGELHLGGPYVALGYLNRSELTAGKFVENPFYLADRASEIDPVLYRTGDRVRFLPDGNLKFLGRIDSQVKVRGFRIELGEVEAVLSRHGDVQETAVVVREDIPGDSRLVAYVVPTAHAMPTAGDLREFLQAKLPDYMVPPIFVIQESLPKTASGKIDRSSLPAPDLSRDVLAEEYVAPRNPIEEDLARMWAEVLHVERVGVHDNFFDLGGHSLIATQLVARVRAEYQVDLPLRHLFETPSVAGIAALISESLLQATDEAELAQILAQIEDLSPDDIEKLLTDEM